MKIVIEIPEGLKDVFENRTVTALDVEEMRTAIKNSTSLPIAERYEPIILQEHDAEPRRLKAILDMETNDIYILETTKGFAEGMGMTIEIKESESE